MRTNKTYAIYWIPPATRQRELQDADQPLLRGRRRRERREHERVLRRTSTTTRPGQSRTRRRSVVRSPTRTRFRPTAYQSCGGPVEVPERRPAPDRDQQRDRAAGLDEEPHDPVLHVHAEQCRQLRQRGRCSYTVYCAYHGYGAGNLIYANQPYAAYSTGCRYGPAPERRPRRRHDQRHESRAPRGDQRRASQRLVQRLHRRTRAPTSAPGTSVPSLGGGPGAEYNQVINSHNYYLQQEWSNDGSTCLLRYGGGGPPPAPTVSSFNPTSGPVGTNVSITGTNFTGVSSGEVQRRRPRRRSRSTRTRASPRDGAERRHDRPDRRHDAERHRHERDELHRDGRWRVSLRP